MRKLLLFFALLCVSVGAWATPTVSTSTWMQNNSAYETQKVAEIYLQNAGELDDALAMVSGDFQYLHLSTNTGVGLNADDIAALNALNVKTIEMNHVSGPYFEFNNPYVEYITLPYNWTKEQVKAVGETHKTHSNFKACISTSDTENSGNATLIAYLNEAGKMRDAILHSYFDTNDYKTLGNGNGDCSRVRTLVAMGNICAKDISRAGDYDANGHYVINGVADENSMTYNMNTEGGDLYSGGSTDGAIVGCYDINVIDLSEAIIPDAYCADIVPGYAFVTTNLREIWIPENSDFKTIPADFLNCSSAVHQICIPGNIETIRTRAFGGSGTRVNYIWTTGSDPSIRYDNGATFITGAGTDSEVRAQRYKTEVGKGLTAAAGFDPATEYPLFQSGDDNSFNYGTFTLPAGLKLIERYAFLTSTSVSDVYMLSTTAPECHVDAFNSSMYHANNTVQSSNIKEETDDDGNTIKIITREAYNNGINQPMTILHYPQDTTTPDLQRYTDPTREYSIATGYRDGKGNMLYFPTQTEFEVAEWEGTHGYLWNAWNIDRTWYNQEIMLGTGQGWYGGAFGSTGGYTAAGQAKANQYYLDNPNPNPTTGTDKTDRSFYDVTADGTLSQPAGLQMYYNTVWEGSTLYPQMETTTTSEIIGQKQSVDENGNPKFEPGDCNYVKDFRYVKDDEGGFVQVATVTGYEGTQSSVDGVSTYYSDNQGSNTATPKVQDGYFVEDGTKPVFSDQASNFADRSYEGQYYSSKDVSSAVTPVLSQSYYYATGNQVPETNTTNKPISGVDTYYTDEGLTASSTPQFNNWNTYYYTTGKTVQIPTYTQTNKPVSGVTEYYDYNHNVVTPGLATWATWYVKNGDNYDAVTTYTPGQTYYQYGWQGGVQKYYEVTPEFDANYYYISAYTSGLEYIQTTEFKSGYYKYYKLNNGNYEEYTGDLFTANFYYATGAMKDEYLSTTEWDRTRTYYTNNNGTYTEVTGDMYFSQQLYKVVGEEPNYSSANGLDYNASTTYYTSNTGAEVVNPVNFDNTYYIPTYDYTYETYTGQEGDRYKQEEYYREGTSDELADATVEKYCPVMEPVYATLKGTQYDYRGWHQFVLANYGYNGVVPNEPIRSFISDNDWWTICEPYDLRYNDLIKFFGTDNGIGTPKKPYLSKLMYVIRDVENGKITLMFSKNLMEYKEAIASDGQVHGTIDDNTKWSDSELADNPVILHKGVPYLIKPNLLEENGKIIGTRAFNVYKTDNLELYNRLNEAAKLGAAAQANMVYDGEYTVPAYVVGLGKDGAGTEGVESTGEKTIENQDGSSFTYKDSENGGKLVYGGKEVDYKISADYTYTFVGSLYKSLMPQYCYFLGYDSKKKKAVFRYSAVQDKSGWNWNNETGIICPNFDTTMKIHSATGFNDPARWTIADANGTMLRPDDITMATGSAKSYTFDFGATNYFEMEEATGVSEMVVKPLYEETKVYDANGIYRGNSLQNLPKGVYIVNGKKYVVK